MKNYELIGLICVAAIENKITMTTGEIVKIAEYLANNGVALEKPVEIDVDIDVEVEEEPAINNPVEELGISKKKQEKLRHATLDDIIKPKATGNALPPREQELYDFAQAHPDASLDEICKGIGIKPGNYRFLRQQLKNKGYKISLATAGQICPKDMQEFKASQQSETDKRIDDAYLGEHPCIQPKPVEKKPLSPREKQLWDYMQNNPDARMPSICEALGISNANYYMLKVQLKKKGWIVSAVENVKEVEL